MARGFYSTLGSGTTDAIVLPYGSHAAQRTYAFWNYRRASTANQRFFDKNTSGTETELLFEVSGGIQLAYSRTFSAARGVWRADLPATGTWYHLTLTYDASNNANDPLIYVNGVSKTITEIETPNGTPTDTADGYVIGNRANDNARGFDGMFAEFAIYDAILTIDEASALAAGASPTMIRPDALVSYAPLVRDTGDRLNGASTVTGTAVQPHPRVIYPGAWSVGVPAGAAPSGVTVPVLMHHYKQMMRR